MLLGSDSVIVVVAAATICLDISSSIMLVFSGDAFFSSSCAEVANTTDGSGWKKAKMGIIKLRRFAFFCAAFSGLFATF